MTREEAMSGPTDPTGEVRPALAGLAQEMRRLRGRAGLSQRALAARMGYVREYVTLAERGVRLPSREFLVRHAHALDATKTLLALWEAAREEDDAIKEAAQAQRRQQDLQLTDQDAARLQALIEPAPLAGGLPAASRADQPAARAVEAASASLDAPAAVGYQRGVGAAGGGRLLTDAADAAVAASRKRAHVDPMTLDELDQDIERFTLECLVVPHAKLFPHVWDDWQQVELFLDARQNLKDRAHLTLLGGQLTYFLARLLFNMGGYAAARRHAALAWQYAEDVGQPVLCASVKTLQGTIAFYAGQHQRALELLRTAEPYETPYSRPRIAANRARAYAVLGEHPRARQALAEMERHLIDVSPQPGDSPYTPATAMSALASTLTRLGDGESAEQYARQAVVLHDVPVVRDTLFEDRGNAALNLAASLVVRRRPQPDEAARLGIQAIAVPEGLRTETVHKRAVELWQLLGDWRTLSAVKDFAERLRWYELPASTT
jgi:transcriptional regulator with XRE-family HTH domain